MKQESFVRLALSFSFFVVAGYVVLALFGWFDGPSQRADSEARKCGSARSINLLGDAERFCRNAIEIVQKEAKIQSGVAALVHVEAAALAMVQERVKEAAAHCQRALLAWRDENEGNRESTVFIPQDMREESIHACEYLIAVATRQPAPVARISDIHQDVGARVSAPMVILVKASELHALRRTERAL